MVRAKSLPYVENNVSEQRKVDQITNILVLMIQQNVQSVSVERLMYKLRTV
jgi:hypothetical protein